ncbi:MAG TPA: S8 family serine peptidase [Candidatus Polarisedimenticolia bacterium]|nr:S8 family serine peptidase [Candidatus Polarisedimenticolia bacterium]
MGFLRLAAGAALCLASALSFETTRAAAVQDPPLRFGLVSNAPQPGRARLSLQDSVARLRHDYGPFSLVQLTWEQESALRAAGYEIDILEGADRIGIGPYSFSLPAGPGNLPADLTWKESRGARAEAFLVRLIGPPAPDWQSRLKVAGAEVLTPIPSFSYLALVPSERRAAIAALPFVEWVGPYHPAFKLSSDLARRHRDAALRETPERLNVLIYKSMDVEGAVNRIRGMHGDILNRSPFDFYDLVTVVLPESLVPDLARMPEVYAVEEAPEPRLEDESSTQILAGQLNNGVPFRPAVGEDSYTDWLAARGLDGSGVTIGYVDNGVMNFDPTNHTTGRVNENLLCGTTGSEGHGQFGAATAGGSCAHPGEAGTGFRYGLGVAPAVNFINIPYLKTSGACNHDDATRARDTLNNTGPNGAHGTIQNNSWGAGGYSSDLNIVEDVSYTSYERTFDILARDGDSTTAGNQPLITCFSAGNEGNTTPNGGTDNPATLTRPHAAKNILTTGSSSVYRPGSGATNTEDRSFFSSQGPTFDGRIKPDFMAPGGAAQNFSAIASASVNGFGSGLADGLHSLSAGTSFATPQTAGGAALLVEWWQGLASAVPSPAMVKALLLNSARDLSGGNTPAAIPNRQEGWGRWNLGNILEPGSPTIVSAPPLFRKTSGLPAVYLDQGVVLGATGDVYQLMLAPADLSKPLKATLVWTDAPGAVSSCPSLVNNLDLELLQNGKDLFRGNAMTFGASVAGAPADAINNVEQIIQMAPSGVYTLTVRGTAIAGDGIPGNADTTDQDFALVVTNATVYSGPILAAGAMTKSDACGGIGAGSNGVIDPGETVTFSFPLVNSGGAAATGITATLGPSTPDVTVLDGSIAYPNIAAGASAGPNAGDTLSIALSDALPCGSDIDLTLTVTTAQGSFQVPVHFDAGAVTLTTQNIAGSTGQVTDDPASPSNFTAPGAVAGILDSVSVDLNISSVDESFLFENYDVALIAPSTTGVTLHSNPLPCQAMSTSYPASRLPQSGTLDIFKGQNPAGTWTLRVTDKNNFVTATGGHRPGSLGTVNSWMVHLTRATPPACTTCSTTVPPPEVSAPESSLPLMLTYNFGTGEISFSWENLGIQADSYRLLQGFISSLANTGVTSSNTAPVLCGLTGTNATLVPGAGAYFYLVAAQKGTTVGSLGEATDQLTYPRTASLACP